VGIIQLEAILYDDMGLTSIENGDRRGAIASFSKAFDLAQRVGEEFRKEYLVYSNYYGCRELGLEKFCRSEASKEYRQ